MLGDQYLLRYDSNHKYEENRLVSNTLKNACFRDEFDQSTLFGRLCIDTEQLYIWLSLFVHLSVPQF